MSTKSDPLGKQAKEVAEDLQTMGETVRGAAQEQLGQVRDKALEYGELARERVRGVEYACGQFLRERPLTSVLIAAGVGWVLGRFWKRR
ncbi:MAG TPA: hypothetical protein VJL29_00730 [Thermoguttaceae bacterium]|nr:hypothetical protein [Thermoguttaceae bacterium]